MPPRAASVVHLPLADGTLPLQLRLVADSARVGRASSVHHLDAAVDTVEMQSVSVADVVGRDPGLTARRVIVVALGRYVAGLAARERQRLVPVLWPLLCAAKALGGRMRCWQTAVVGGRTQRVWLLFALTDRDGDGAPRPMPATDTRLDTPFFRLVVAGASGASFHALAALVELLLVLRTLATRCGGGVLSGFAAAVLADGEADLWCTAAWPPALRVLVRAVAAPALTLTDADRGLALAHEPDRHQALQTLDLEHFRLRFECGGCGRTPDALRVDGGGACPRCGWSMLADGWGGAAGGVVRVTAAPEATAYRG